MKKMIALLLMLLLTAGAALAETEITVYGSGSTLVSADTAVITLGVEARDREVLKAQQKANEVISAIRKAMKEAGVKDEDINTDYINIYAAYDYSNDTDEITGYRASSSLAIRVADTQNAGQLIDAAFSAGANTLNGISFSASDTEKEKAEAVKLAVADARARAEVMAEAAGLKITGIKYITDGGVHNYENDSRNFKAAGATEEAETGTVVQAARIMILANVTVVFTAE